MDDGHLTTLKAPPEQVVLRWAKKLSKRGGNTVGKVEIVRYEQFLLFPQCFQKACFPGASKGVIVWEWVKPVVYLLMYCWPLTKWQNFGCDQIESTCRQQIECC